MPKSPQLSLMLPGLKSSHRPAVEVRRHIRKVRRTLNGLHVRSQELFDVLTNPDKHWRMVRHIKNGKERICYAMSPALDLAQRRLLKHLRGAWISRLRCSPFATAFRRGTSIVRNAEFHSVSHSNLRLDLSNAFEQITTRHIERRFKRDREKKCMGGERSIEVPEPSMAWIISRVATYRGRLRQGGRMSPLIFNAMMLPLDEAICDALGITGKNAAHLPVKYTRYADDICLSSTANEFPAELERKVREAIVANHFTLNEKKTVRSGNGVLELPGIQVVDHVIRPNVRYTTRTISAANGFTPLVLKGHRAYLSQFKRKDLVPALRRALAL